TLDSPKYCQNIYHGEDGNIHVLSVFQTQVRFDNGLILSNPDSTQIDAFHAVYDTLGNLLSAVRFGENGGVHGEGIHFFEKDQHNNTYRYVNDENTLLKYNTQGDTVLVKELSVSGGTLYLEAME